MGNMNLAGVIEHTFIKPDCTLNDIKKICAEALQYQFRGVCIPPYYVKDAYSLLRENAKIISVVGFPFGYSAIPAKVEEIKRAIDEGADEIDAVLNLCAIKNGQWSFVRSEIDSIGMATSMKGKTIKLILETSLLSREELKRTCEICLELGVPFVETSTGLNGAASADAETVTYLKSLLGSKVKIKASGNISNRKTAEALLNAGADRIGSTNSLAILGV